MKRLILYGSGKRCRMLIRVLKNSHIEVIGVVDSDSEKWGKECCGFMVESPEILKRRQDFGICVTFYSMAQHEPVWEWIKRQYDIPDTDIYALHDVLLEHYRMQWKRLLPVGQDDSNNLGKVLFDASWGLGLGGVEAWLKDIIEGFDGKDEEDIYLLTKPNQKNVPQEVERHIIDFYYPDAFSFTAESVEKGIRFLEEQLPCTLVMSTTDELLLAAVILKEQYPKQLRIIMSVHNSCDGMYRDILSYRDGIDQYVCVSTGMRNDMIARGISPDQVYVMTCPIVSNIPMRNDEIDIDAPLRIGYAGRLEVCQKRLDLLLRLLDELETRKIDYCLNIAGTGNYAENIRSYTQTRKLEDKIVLGGQIAREQMNQFWSRQDIAVNISDWEGRPISNMEAMANGAIPIVTNTIGVLDDVKDGINGYVVPVGDYRTMAERIAYLAEHRETMSRMRTAAVEEMREKCNIDTHIRLWKEILNNDVY